MGRGMKHFLVKRLLLSLFTLVLLSLMVFFGTQALTGNVGRRILGPFAPEEAVASLNRELGTDRPIMTQYFSWLGGLVRGELGHSYAFKRPAADLLFPAFGKSAKLAVLAFLLVVPLAVLGGVVAAFNEGRFLDRLISLGGLSAAVIPEFVWAVVLIMVFGLGIKVLPVTAQAPLNSSFLVEIKHLVLPSMCVFFLLFGYIARMARAGTVEALKSDYIRTAVLKGLTWGQVVRRHVLRNALSPTIAVVATQTVFLIGSLVAIELVFNYPGLGQLIFRAAKQADFPLLVSAVFIVGLIFIVVTFLADLCYVFLNPRLRQGKQA